MDMGCRMNNLIYLVYHTLIAMAGIYHGPIVLMLATVFAWYYIRRWWFRRIYHAIKPLTPVDNGTGDILDLLIAVSPADWLVEDMESYYRIRWCAVFHTLLTYDGRVRSSICRFWCLGCSPWVGLRFWRLGLLFGGTGGLLMVAKVLASVVNLEHHLADEVLDAACFFDHNDL